ncbi:ABC transporter substrate-binding protein [Cecembia sp.]|uniref:ABC transporter substrate-binding protein n=1 Tax=Cecembia sp. TaxID=1898110 RepID=UPI0025BB8555|nr:ABC transporter substrate-binding protein [Cecembia sp.]
MEQLIITGVPEHFNFPWLKVIAEQPFLSAGIELVWKNESKGSGAMNKAIREEETDLAITLTESFIKDKVEGNPGRIIGWYVKSPLIWGVHLSGKCMETKLNSLQNVPFLISRFGSGSHLMAYLLAKRENWDLSSLIFEEIGDLEGAKKSFESSGPKLFLWEKFTTKPLVDAGLFKRIDEIPTPWPCFVIVASKKAMEKYAKVLPELRDKVYQKAGIIKRTEGILEEMATFYAQKPEDLKSWLKDTFWAEDSSMGEEELANVFHNLVDLKIIERMEFKPNVFVEENFVNLIKP